MLYWVLPKPFRSSTIRNQLVGFHNLGGNLCIAVSMYCVIVCDNSLRIIPCHSIQIIIKKRFFFNLMELENKGSWTSFHWKNATPFLPKIPQLYLLQNADRIPSICNLVIHPTHKEFHLYDYLQSQEKKEEGLRIWWVGVSWFIGWI